jgi:hypothetical protein
VSGELQQRLEDEGRNTLNRYDRYWAAPGWTPGLIDYVYTSLTNATAFSPTDTMPLTPMAKSLMAVQSLTALVTIGLVVARAVNIL